MNSNANSPYLNSYSCHNGDIHGLFVVYNHNHDAVYVYLSTIITDKILKEKPNDKLRKMILKPLFHKRIHQNRRNTRYGIYHNTSVIVKRMKIRIGKLRVLQFKLGIGRI